MSAAHHIAWLGYVFDPLSILRTTYGVITDYLAFSITNIQSVFVVPLAYGELCSSLGGPIRGNALVVILPLDCSIDLVVVAVQTLHLDFGGKPYRHFSARSRSRIWDSSMRLASYGKLSRSSRLG